MRFVSTLALLAGLTSPLSAAEIIWDGENLAIEDAEGALEKVLEEVARAVDAELILRGELGEVPRRSFPAADPGQVLRELVRPHTLVVRFDADTGAPNEIIVRESKEGSPAPARRVSRVGRAPQPEAAPVDQAEAQAFRDELRDLIKRTDPGVSGELQALYQATADPSLRRLALVTLVRRGGPTATQTLRTALGDEDANIRLEAARGLAALLGSAAKADITRVLAHEQLGPVHDALERLLQAL